MSAAGSGAPATYRERLTPPVIWYVVAAVIGGSFGLVVLPFAGPPGFLVGALAGAAVAAGILVLTSTGIEVTEGTLRAGRAAIPIHLLGPATVLEPAAMARLRGPDFNPRAYVCQRAWVRGGVRLDVDDPADPTPYWLISTQHPQQLADAIEAQRATG
jgi:Protein of unknown function (DUF3093)